MPFNKRKIMSNSNSVFDLDDLRPIFKFIGKNWYLFILLPVIFYGIAYIYSYRLPDIYAAKTEILLKSSETYDYQNGMNASFGYFSTVQDVINQKRVLKSYDIIEETLERLNFDINYYLGGGVREDEVFGFKYIYFDLDPSHIPSVYKNTEYTIEILDEVNYNFTYSLGNEKVTKKFQFGKPNTEPFLFTVFKTKFFTAENLDEITDKKYKIFINSKKNLVQKYNANLDILNEEYTSILTLNLQDSKGEKAKMFLDTLSKVYTDYSVENQIKINENTRSYIEKQLAELKEILDSLEFELQRYRESKNIFNLSREQEELFNKLTDLEVQKQVNELRLNSLSSVFDYTVKNIDEVSLPPIIDSKEDHVLAEQVNTLYQLKLDRADLLTYYTNENYTVQKQDTLIKLVTKGIRNYLESARNIIKDKGKDIDFKIKKTITGLKNIPKSQQGIMGIQRKVQVNEGLYQFLLEKRASTVIARAAIIPQVSVIESARSLGTVGPNRSKINFGAAGAGLVLAFLIGLIRLLFFERIENLQEFKQITSLPVLGGLPFYKNIGNTPLALQDDSRSNVSEAFRALRANLQYMLKSENKVKKMLVSSLHPSEGKTYVSTNLASFLARTNKKVILIDFDMHKPKVHKTLNITNKKGLSSFLIGKLQMDDIINYDVATNLDVITAGPIPPNASDLILTDKVDELLAQLEKYYDYIVFDTPPLMLISDALVLLEKVDLGLFVFNSEKATKEGVRFLEDILEQNNLKNIAFILNGIKQKKWAYYKGKYYSSRYAYKYGYGSGYGYYEAKGGYGSDYQDEE